MSSVAERSGSLDEQSIITNNPLNRSNLSPEKEPSDDISTNRDPGNSRTSITIDSVRPSGNIKTRVKSFVLAINYNGNNSSRTRWDSREGSWDPRLQILPENPVHIELRRTSCLSRLGIRKTRFAYGTLDCDDFEEAVLSGKKEIRKDITLTGGGYMSDSLPLTFKIAVHASPAEPVPIEPQIYNAATVDGVRAVPQIVVSDDQGQSATSMGVYGTHNASPSSISPTRPPTPHKAELAPQDAYSINVTSDDQGPTTTSVKDVYDSRNASASLISLVPTRPPTPSPHLDTVSSYSGVAKSAGDTVGKVLTTIQPIADFLDQLAKVHPIAEVTWLVCSSAYKVILAQHKRDQEIVDLYDEMIGVYECATKDDMLNRKDQFSALFTAMIDQSVDCCVFIANYSSDGYLKRLLGNINASEKIRMFREAFQRLKSDFNDAQIRSTTFMMQGVSDVLVGLRPHIESVDRSEQLRVLKTIELKPRESCLPKTRQETLRKIIDWTMQGKESILWISGVAGCGKSSVMATLNDYFISLPHSRLATYIRFDRFALNDPSVFVCTLAYQLAMFDSRIGASISRVVETQPRICNHTQLSEQFRVLVRGPLTVDSAVQDEGPVVILIDGLDECMQQPGGSHSFHQLLSLLSNPKTFEDFPFLRFIIASRPEGPIRQEFDGKEHVHHFPLDITTDETLADIRQYLFSKFKGLYKKNPAFEKVCLSEDIHFLSVRASGLFIWAVTAFRFLEIHPTRQRLREVLALTPPRDAVTALTDLYTIILSVLFKEGQTTQELVCAVFGFVLAFKTVRSSLNTELPTDPSLTPLVLSGLLSNTGYDVNAENILPFLSKLASIIPGDLGHDQPIIFLHKSFDDFLLDPVRSKEYYVNSLEWERRFADACVSTARFNILRKDPEYSDTFHFANYYWLITGIKVRDDITTTRYFLDMVRRHLLRWLYVVRKGTSEDIGIDRHLRNILMVCRDGVKWRLDTIKHMEDSEVALLQQLKELFAFLSRDLPLAELFQAFFHFLCHQSSSSPLYTLYVPRFTQWANGSADFDQINKVIENGDLQRFAAYEDEIDHQDVDIVNFDCNSDRCSGCSCPRYSGSSKTHGRWLAAILEDTSVIAEVLKKLSGMLRKKHELDEKLVDLIVSMNQLYGCAIVQDALNNYNILQVLFDAMIHQTVECFLVISNYVSDGYFSEIYSMFVFAIPTMVLTRIWTGHMTTVSENFERFKLSFEQLNTRFNSDLLHINTVINMEAKDLVVGLHESIQQRGNETL
ncbi:hypothetical protein V5O48_012700 [Marasmius crinis-equi]|uniref:Nephrocystin 3-like N-terminal domain-containing protein n=1 Tax=Marasmius crinis-equi TaxID=585013 RepID=A0ABR3F236_9AGAR